MLTIKPFNFKGMEKHNLTINSSDREAFLRLLDSRDKIVLEATGKIETTLPNGLYTLQWVSNGIMQERQIKHRDKATVFTADRAGSYSSALLNGYSSSHEYYTGPAMMHSIAVTGDVGKVPKSEECSLFLFVRFASIDQARKLMGNRTHILENFELLDSDFGRITDLASEHVCRQNVNDGWAAVSLKLRPGLYFIHFSNEKMDRLIPVYLFTHWQTQVFLIMRKSPIFETLRVLMAELRVGFDPSDEANRELDHALLKLQNRNYTLSPHIAELLALGKWRNPLLGIIWCYIYLREGKRDQERLFETILGNLSGPILESSVAPDLQAIRLMKALRDDNTELNFTFTNPPFFKVGFREVVQASYSNPNLIPPRTRMSSLASKLLSDTPWATFDGSYFIYSSAIRERLDLTKDESIRILKKRAARFKTLGPIHPKLPHNRVRGLEPGETLEGLSTASLILSDQITTWEVVSIVSTINARLKDPNPVALLPTVSEVAQEVGLPPSTILEVTEKILSINNVLPVANVLSQVLGEQLDAQVIEYLRKLLPPNKNPQTL